MSGAKFISNEQTPVCNYGFRILAQAQTDVQNPGYSHINSNNPGSRGLCIPNADKSEPWVSVGSQSTTHNFNRRRWAWGGLVPFFIRWLDIKDEERKAREQKIKSRRDELLKRYSEFHFASRMKPIELSWRQYIELFPSHKIFLQHLYTGHRVLYDLLDHDQLKFENGLQQLLYGFSLHTDSLDGVCNDCLKLYDEKDIPRLRESIPTHV